MNFENITPEEEKEIIKDWLKHPGTKLMAARLRKASRIMLRGYDDAIYNNQIELARRLSISRRFINKELPEMIGRVMDYDSDKKWSVNDWFKGFRKRAR